jgi:hypothetical protein
LVTLTEDPENYALLPDLFDDNQITTFTGLKNRRKNLKKIRQNKRHQMTSIPSFVNLCHLFTFCHSKNQLGKYTPPYGTA